MGSETLLTLLMMAAVVAVFAVFHLLLRRLPFKRSYPHEHYRWPVWNWYAIVVGVGILVGLAANLYWMERTPQTGPPGFADEHLLEIDILPTSGRDADAEKDGQSNGQKDDDAKNVPLGPTRLAKS